MLLLTSFPRSVRITAMSVFVNNPAIEEVEAKGRAAKIAARTLATAGTDAKNAALAAMAEALGTNQAAIIDANGRDLAAAKDNGMTAHLIERLTLNAKRIGEMQTGLTQVAALPDPIGAVLSGWRRPNGLQITKTRVPLGVIGIIYESRPNVTVDAAALCLKSGNAALLRGGSEAIHSNICLANVLQSALETAGLPQNAIQLIASTDRSAARRLMTLNGFVDCLIPRGGASLIKTVVENATVPVIETGTGNCHVYVDKDADLVMAAEIVLNAKTQRPSVCNSAETLLVHEQIAAQFLTLLGPQLAEAEVEVRADVRACCFLPAAIAATEEDWYTEYNALILAVKVVESLDAAVAHINTYGTQHSEAIVTENYAAAQAFTGGVDCAAVYVNASTRFTDGFEFGFGAEIGISNQKLHARGPMGLEELTTYKYIVRGSGQVRE
jgi:glutamate-5-semialdehyde dehydrogenase